MALCRIMRFRVRACAALAPVLVWLILVRRSRVSRLRLAGSSNASIWTVFRSEPLDDRTELVRWFRVVSDPGAVGPAEHSCQDLFTVRLVLAGEEDFGGVGQRFGDSAADPGDNVGHFAVV